jgi:integrase family protein with SAM-like domain
MVRNRAVGPDEDNMLKISGDGRRAALDLRLAGLPQKTPGKPEAAAGKIAAIWQDCRDRSYRAPDGRAYPARGALQLVFCDLGTPGDGWNVYHELRSQLAARGVPGDAVRVIHQAKTDRDKARLFAACRTGRVAVLAGSTEKMGVGTNVQDRAIALHHLDAPWRPVDVAQREGRIVRQGNLNPEVEIYRWVTEGGFDGYMWLLNRAGRRGSRSCHRAMPGSARARPIGRGALRAEESAMAMAPDDLAGPGAPAPVRDVGSLQVPLAGSVVAGADDAGYRVVFPPDARAAAACNEYLADLRDTFARPLTMRSYGYDILRWLRFLAALEVAFDEAARSDYSDFVRWLRAAGKAGGARRARTAPLQRRVNQETGKIAPDDMAFGPATLAHSRIVLHEFYEFLLDRGHRPLINPVPHSRRRERGQLRQYPHHNPLEEFGRTRPRHRRFDPPNRRVLPGTCPIGTARSCGRSCAVTATAPWSRSPSTAGPGPASCSG